MWAPEARVTLVPSSTQASWMDPVESHAGDLRKLALDGRNFESCPDMKRAFRQEIGYRNRECKLCNKRSRDTEVGKWKIRRRAV